MRRSVLHQKSIGASSMTKKTNGLQKAGDLLRDVGDLPVAPRESPGTASVKRPSNPDFDNTQLSLFQSFLCNTDEERERFSNAIDLWDSVPRYSVNRQTMTKARANGKFLDNYQLTFQYRGRTYTSTVS